MEKQTIDENKQEVLAVIKKERKNKKLPKDILNKIYKKIFYAIVMAIVLIVYFAVLNMAYNSMQHERLVEDIKVFSGTFLLIGLLILEKAYKEDRGSYAVTGIEFLVISFHSLSITHVISMFNYDFRFYLLTSSYIFAIYYVLKGIVIYVYEKRKYLKKSSDIPEILKKEEPIKKEAKKRLENESAEDETIVEHVKKSTKGKKHTTTKATKTTKTTKTAKTAKTAKTKSTKKEATKRKTAKKASKK